MSSANMVPIGDDKTSVPLKVHGQLNGVDQESSLQLSYETGQRPENQISTLGLVLRKKVESGEQVTESFNIPEGFFEWMVPEPTKSDSSLGAPGH